MQPRDGVYMENSIPRYLRHFQAYLGNFFLFFKCQISFPVVQLLELYSCCFSNRWNIKNIHRCSNGIYLMAEQTTKKSCKEIRTNKLYLQPNDSFGEWIVCSVMWLDKNAVCLSFLLLTEPTTNASQAHVPTDRQIDNITE